MQETKIFSGFGDLAIAADIVGTGPPVLLLHGGGQTRRSWRRTVDTLSRQGYQAISLDARGHGDSGWSEDGQYDMDMFAGDILAVVATLPVAPAIIGASLGGLSALLAVGENDASTAAALILVDIAVQQNAAGIDSVRNFMTANPAGFQSVAEAADAVQRYLPHRSRPSDVSGLRRNLRETPDGRFVWHWDPRFMDKSGQDRTAFTERLDRAARHVRIPTMLVHGALSEVVDDDAIDHFRDAVPHAEIIEVARAGHMIAGDENNAFDEAILDFLIRWFPASRA